MESKQNNSFVYSLVLRFSLKFFSRCISIGLFCLLHWLIIHLLQCNELIFHFSLYVFFKLWFSFNYLLIRFQTVAKLVWIFKITFYNRWKKCLCWFHLRFEKGRCETNVRFVCLFVCLFVWVLRHINLCKLFNAKSVFTQTNSSISNNSVWL